MSKLTTAALKIHLDELTAIPANWKKIVDHIDRYGLDVPETKRWKRISKRKTENGQVVRLFTLESEEDELGNNLLLELLVLHQLMLSLSRA